MDEPVDHRGAGHVVAEDLASLRWSALGPLLRRLSFYLRRWAAKTDKRLRTHKRFQRSWTGLQAREPGLFAHWQWIRSY